MPQLFFIIKFLLNKYFTSEYENIWLLKPKCERCNIQNVLYIFLIDVYSPLCCFLKRLPPACVSHQDCIWGDIAGGGGGELLPALHLLTTYYLWERQDGLKQRKLPCAPKTIRNFSVCAWSYHPQRQRTTKLLWELLNQGTYVYLTT